MNIIKQLQTIHEEQNKIQNEYESIQKNMNDFLMEGGEEFSGVKKILDNPRVFSISLSNLNNNWCADAYNKPKQAKTVSEFITKEIKKGKKLKDIVDYIAKSRKVNDINIHDEIIELPPIKTHK